MKAFYIGIIFVILSLKHILVSSTKSSVSSTSFCTKEDHSCKNAIPINKMNQARYDFYRIYYVHLDTEEQVKVFQDLEAKSDSHTFYGHARHTDQKLTIMVAAHKIADFVDLLELYKVEHRVLTYNFQEKIDRQNLDVQPKNISPNRFDWDHYFHLETIYDWLALQAKDHKLELIEMGNSHEGIPIKGIKFISNPSNPTVFIESGIHAREWIAPATATFLLNELLTSTDNKIKKYAQKLNWVIFPVVNPDGYKYTFEKDRMWRKNRRFFGLCRGVDLNRNFPFHWNETGSSDDQCAYDYAGPEGASEDETKCIIKFIEDNISKLNIKTYIALHSFSQLIMFPYGFTPEKVENYNDLKAIGDKAVESIKEVTGKVYKSGSLYETIYPSSGGSKDWSHAIGKIPITYTFELRGAPDSEDLFILPASEIRDTGKEAVAAIMTIVEEADKRGYYNN
ncbi:zinc carboxypeptidase [Condylostylus longicornis]|uniref:zinc carboxypeptidase n=1 Tax=Condylostylus longicornis TaxID=2530218 RepID=UPI00244DDC31|nr:zinc carboxypeptidase [Condylostylus longicornis]